MTTAIPIYLAVEDDLSQHVLRRVLNERTVRYEIGSVYSQRGFGYLKRQTASFNNAAKASPFLLLTDLDNYQCPPDLINEWLTSPQHRHFLLRVAVREVESWLLGDEEGLRLFLGYKKTITIPNPEMIPDPKAELLRLAISARNRFVREAIVWKDKRTGKLFQGADYNGTLAGFVKNQWNIATARQRCPSLERVFKALARLEKDYNK
jgi:hypothetical protein